MWLPHKVSAGFPVYLHLSSSIGLFFAHFSFSRRSFKLFESSRRRDAYELNRDFSLPLPGRFALEAVHLLAPVIGVGGLDLSERRGREETWRRKRREESEGARWL